MHAPVSQNALQLRHRPGKFPLATNLFASFLLPLESLDARAMLLVAYQINRDLKLGDVVRSEVATSLPVDDPMVPSIYGWFLPSPQAILSRSYQSLCRVPHDAKKFFKAQTSCETVPPVILQLRENGRRRLGDAEIKTLHVATDEWSRRETGRTIENPVLCSSFVHEPDHGHMLVFI